MGTLNPQQDQAVRHTHTPLLIVAGAGSGKTMVITHKIKHLIDSGVVEAGRILAITFTNKAANEMKERVAVLLGEREDAPYISTFHSFCGDVLRQDFRHLGGPNNYVIYDQSDQTRLVKQILKELNLDEKVFVPAAMLGRIERLKNTLTSFQQFKRKAAADDKLALIYEKYQTILWQNKALDFGDMLFFTNMLFHNCPHVLEKYQDRFQYVMVDEYQDTNHAQYNLVRMLAAKYRQLTVVGDFDQNIYSWRGANLENMMRFEKDYPEATVVMLEQNYRSTGTILKAANSLIQYNKNRRDKNLWTANGEGEKLFHFTSADERDEARFIANTITELKAKQVSLNDIVILYRINALSRVLEEQLTQAEIPYRMVGGLKFFDRQEIKDMIAYLRYVHNPADMFAFARIANVPARDIGNTTLNRLMSACQRHGCGPEEVFSKEPGLLPARSARATEAFLELIRDIRAEFQRFTGDKVGQLMRLVLERTGYERMLKEGGGLQGEERLENLYELITLAREEEMELGEFLNKIALITELDSGSGGDAAVTLMTLHNAKGLEYDYVFIAGFEDGLLPHYRARDNEEEMEEERRLCYVGITRARQRLYFTQCESRSLFGESRPQTPSAFLEELPSSLIEKIRSSEIRSFRSFSMDPVTTGGIRMSTSSGNKQPLQSFKVGDRVKHSVWGEGKIVKVEGEGENAVIYGLFEGIHKKLIAKYAPLTHITD